MNMEPNDRSTKHRDKQTIHYLSIQNNRKPRTIFDNTLLGAFAKFAKNLFLASSCLSICLSVCPPVRIAQLCSHWIDFFREVLYFSTFRKSVENFDLI